MSYTTKSPSISAMGSEVRISSPLNPISSLSPSSSTTGRPRGHSASAIQSRYPYQHPLSPNSSSYSNTSPSSSASSQIQFRALVDDNVWHKHPGSSSTWNSSESFFTAPWGSEKGRAKKEDEGEEDKGEDWKITRSRVSLAASEILGTTLDLAHELLEHGADVLQLAPIPGLQMAARALLQIWDMVQMVDMNRSQCLRLTERCADILLSVQQEVKEAGIGVGRELALPLAKLTESFESVHVFLQKQVHRPFLKRYLKREEIQGQIAGCDVKLQQALGMFELSIQVRIFKLSHASEERRQQDTQDILETLKGVTTHLRPPNSLRLSDNWVGDDVTPTQSMGGMTPTQSRVGGMTPTQSRLGISDSLSTIMPGVPVPFQYHQTATPNSASTQLLSHLLAVHSRQNALDAARDADELRRMMRAALSAGSDAEMVRVLGVEREEMAEAIKTMQRVLEGQQSMRSAYQLPPSPYYEQPVLPQKASTSGLGRMMKRLSVKAKSKKGNENIGAGGSMSSFEGVGPDFKPPVEEDTLDREFIEGGIDALRRLSRCNDIVLNLPSWTITRYEVDREQKIGIGFFSDVFKGTWRGRTVAIKVLADTTPSNLFVKEVKIWKGLKHPNVLELCGASSASGDPPWFFVSPFMRRGNLAEFLRRGAESAIARADSNIGCGGEGRFRTTSLPNTALGMGSLMGLVGGSLVRDASGRTRSGSISSVSSEGREWDLLRFMHEISDGMAYLHSEGVVHGDLKASNILVTENVHCVITDFGQSDMKSEAYRISNTQPPHGTLRWQAPEIMSGGEGTLTPEVDVYAFAMTCVEILGMGRIPWALLDDESVRHFVLREQVRPTIPVTKWTSGTLCELLKQCWDQDPGNRPDFAWIGMELGALRREGGVLLHGSTPTHTPTQSPRLFEGYELGSVPRTGDSPDMRPSPLRSPDMRPNEMSGWPGGFSPPLPRPSSPGSDTSSFITARDTSQQSDSAPVSYKEEIVVPSERTRMLMPEPVLYIPSGHSMSSTSLSSSILSSDESGSLKEAEEGGNMYNVGRIDDKFKDKDGDYDSSKPVDDQVEAVRNERRYRMLLSHEFHPSLQLPLWHPTYVELGAVGYLSKPTGEFVTLFNGFTPELANSRLSETLPSIYGYGKVGTGHQTILCDRRISEVDQGDTRSVARKGLDAIAGLLTFGNVKGETDDIMNQGIARRYSFPLRAGHKAAWLCTENTVYRYVESLEAPKKWFKASVDKVLDIYGMDHGIRREDLFLIIGTLNAEKYGLYVGHSHPDGQAHFNVYGGHGKRDGNGEWGVFSMDTDILSEGPVYHEVTGRPVSACKVSSPNARDGVRWDSVLLARLRFRTDGDQPTSL